MAEKTVKKKENFFKRFGKGFVRFFRDTKGEMKKVVWPSRSQVLNNFLVVVIFVVIAAIVIFGLDAIFGFAFKSLIGLASGA